MVDIVVMPFIISKLNTSGNRGLSPNYTQHNPQLYSIS